MLKRKFPKVLNLKFNFMLCGDGIYKENNKFFYLIRKNLFKFMESQKNNFTKFNKNIFQYEINSYPIKAKIELNEKEKEIFKLINSIILKNNKNTVCRVAGGWVRDKVN